MATKKDTAEPIEHVDEPVELNELVEAAGTGIPMEGIEVPVDAQVQGFNLVVAGPPSDEPAEEPAE